MKFIRCLFGAFVALFSATVYGGTVYQCSFQPDQMSGWKVPDFAALEKSGDKYAMRVTVPESKAAEQNFVSRSFDLKPYRGKTLFFICQAKADKVSKPEHSWNGIKFMLHYRTASGDVWKSAGDLYGTFGWTDIVFSAPDIPNDATDGTFSVGLQESFGTVRFTDIRVFIYNEAEFFPAVTLPADFKCEYTDMTKNMPPLRGVMSPHNYKPGDLDDLAKWNANLIRWQLVRNWGKTGQERDKAEYSAWIDKNIAELDKVLTHANRLGIKVIIDLHSPPGGRYPDKDMAMFYEQEYADLFIEVWKKLATHFKGNPAVWAYDLVNEPVQKKPAKTDYLTLQIQAAKAIRAIDPDVPIVIESNSWAAPATFTYLKPLPMKDIIYQVHMYEPFWFTHQNVYTNWGGSSTKPSMVNYPGMVNGKNHNRETLGQCLQPVIDFQKKYGARIYAGEFSAARWAPGAAQYLEDCISIFEENKWDWSYHAYREFSGWSVEHSNDPYDNKPSTTDTDRKKVLLKYLQNNR